MTSARRRAGFLLYAAIQFVVLTAIAMRVRAGGYDFFGNFLSELGATRTWTGLPNHPSAVLFGIALGTLGVAFVAFAGTWRAFAFDRGRVRALGIVGQVLGTLSGLAFLGVAVTPIDHALDLHNTLVIAAFGLLLGYAVTLTIVWGLNGAARSHLASSIAYVLLVCGYGVSVAVAVRVGLGTERSLWILVVSQKVVAYASMLHIIYLTLAIRSITDPRRSRP